MYLLDTNICIYLLKNTYPVLTERVFRHDPIEVCISSITVFELEYGAEKSNWGEKTRQKLAMFLSPFTILPFATDDAVEAGRIRGYLEKKGTPIGPYDLQIAAQGISRNIIVVTNNIQEFVRVPGLQVEDWVGSGNNKKGKL